MRDSLWRESVRRGKLGGDFQRGIMSESEPPRPRLAPALTRKLEACLKLLELEIVEARRELRDARKRYDDLRYIAECIERLARQYLKVTNEALGAPPNADAPCEACQDRRVVAEEGGLVTCRTCRFAPPIDLASVRDPNFTGGLHPVEYLDRLHDGTLKGEL